MQPIQEPITGNEDQGDLSSPYQTLVQFYRAFNNGNLSLMEKNWANTDEIAMDNPLGGIKRGWAEIREVYERIFSGPPQVYVEYYDYTIHQTSEMFYAVGRERGYFRFNGEEVKLAIRTSRIFRKIDGRWRQVHHHGSIDDPQLLAKYQDAVMVRKAWLPDEHLKQVRKNQLLAKYQDTVMVRKAWLPDEHLKPVRKKRVPPRFTA